MAKQTGRKQNSPAAVIPTENECYGYYGTMKEEFGRRQMKAVWNLTFGTLAAMLDWDSQKIRQFLDSRIGRALADALLNLEIPEVEDIPRSLREVRELPNFIKLFLKYN
jgi:hypothetical protein